MLKKRKWRSREGVQKTTDNDTEWNYTLNDLEQNSVGLHDQSSTWWPKKVNSFDFSCLKRPRMIWTIIDSDQINTIVNN